MDKKQKLELPLIPLRDMVVYPHMVLPLFVGRPESIKALDIAMEQNKQVFLVAQKDAAMEKPAGDDLYKVGVIATILQLLRLPDGTVKVLVEGLERAKLVTFVSQAEYLSAVVKSLSDVGGFDDVEMAALTRTLFVNFEQFIKLNKKVPAEILATLNTIEDPSRLADSVMAHLNVSLESRQHILESLNIKNRVELILKVLGEELELAEVEKNIQERVKNQVEKSQRQYYLSEKIKAIQGELGELEDNGPVDEIKQLEEQIVAAGMPTEAQEKAEAELSKLKMMPPMSAEATVCRNYLEWLLDVPWKKRSKVGKDLVKAEKILETDHYGLEKVKERILEYLAVQQRVEKIKGPILCLVGPPGVGKTSLGQSIANATGRKFVRISLGGVRDEAEIRGHRRTYIGALPGKIIQKMAKVKVRNPLFMLDEVDKMAMDFRGDPASALLEVLDPEQNNTFNDHYLEVDYDLSDVMFVTTANSLDIPSALLDRMEVIRLAGYTEDEKLNIAMKYLIPRQIKQNGLKASEIKITENSVRDIVRYYTREAGVRSLEREISKICRKVVKEILLGKKSKSKAKSKTKSTTKIKMINVTPRNLEKYLGVKRFRFGLMEAKDQTGQVTGLAWTEVGGDLLTIEAAVMPGKGKSIYTGRLGDVMQESIHAAMSVVRSRSQALGIEEDFFQKHDFHVHVPEGATPKDGPSAGIGMCTALASAMTKIPVRAGIAMTGEITLRGEVLPIGGLKEKLLAALRGEIKEVIIPEENKRDLKEIPKEVTEALTIHPVKWMDQVLELALVRQPEPLTKDFTVMKTSTSKKSRKASQSRTDTH